jgi:hypothetical protein
MSLSIPDSRQTRRKLREFIRCRVSHTNGAIETVDPSNGQQFSPTELTNLIGARHTLIETDDPRWVLAVRRTLEPGLGKLHINCAATGFYKAGLRKNHVNVPIYGDAVLCRAEEAGE